MYIEPCRPETPQTPSAMLTGYHELAVMGYHAHESRPSLTPGMTYRFIFLFSKIVENCDHGRINKKHPKRCRGILVIARVP